MSRMEIKDYTGWPKNRTVDFLGLCSDQQLSFVTLLDRASFPRYNLGVIINEEKMLYPAR